MSAEIKATFMTIWEILAALIWTIYLRKVSVSNLAFIAFISSEGVVTVAAACVYVALLGHWTDHIAATLLHINTHKKKPNFIQTWKHQRKTLYVVNQTCILVQRCSHSFVSTKWAWQLVHVCMSGEKNLHLSVDINQWTSLHNAMFP